MIEVAPKNFGVYEVENSTELVCSNHFQSEAFKNDKRNLKTIENSHTLPRYQRMTELLKQNKKINPQKAVEILRDRKGVDNKKLGMGNELAINQLLAHHGIVFKPESRQVWVSSNPYQMGAFVSYDLKKAFAEFENENYSLKGIDSLKIAEAEFIHTKAFKNYQSFRKQEENIKNAIKTNKTLSKEKINVFKALNPYFWKTYYLVGNYYYAKENYKKAVIHYKQALKREVTTKEDVKKLEKLIKKSYRKI